MNKITIFQWGFSKFNKVLQPLLLLLVSGNSQVVYVCLSTKPTWNTCTCKCMRNYSSKIDNYIRKGFSTCITIVFITLW